MSILQQLIEWDKELLLFLNSMHTPFGDKFMWVYTGKYTWIPLILSLLFVLFRKNWKEALLVCVALAITITCCDQFASTLCKPIGNKLRGLKGCLMATLGTILPSFLIILATLLRQIETSP